MITSSSSYYTKWSESPNNKKLTIRKFQNLPFSPPCWEIKRRRKPCWEASGEIPAWRESQETETETPCYLFRFSQHPPLSFNHYLLTLLTLNPVFCVLFQVIKKLRQKLHVIFFASHNIPLYLLAILCSLLPPSFFNLFVDNFVSVFCFKSPEELQAPLRVQASTSLWK